MQGQLLDTMLAHYLIDPEKRHNLDYLAETELGYKNIEITELMAKKSQKISMREVPLKTL